MSYLTNEINQYTEIASGQPVAPEYDADGNMTELGDWVFTWDAENRLITATDGTNNVVYTYDYQGRMVEKTVDSAATRYLWDGFNIIAEIRDNGTRYNVWGLDLSQSLQGAGGVGGLLAVIDGEDIYFACYDANGNVTDYVDEDGTIVAHRDYSPFGETTALTGSMQNAFTHWWSTKPWDPLTGLSEYEFRMYHPRLGRWINRDPIEEEGGVNLYGFVNNSAVTTVDIIGWMPARSGSIRFNYQLNGTRIQYNLYRGNYFNLVDAGTGSVEVSYRVSKNYLSLIIIKDSSTTNENRMLLNLSGGSIYGQGVVTPSFLRNYTTINHAASFEAVLLEKSRCCYDTVVQFIASAGEISFGASSHFSAEGEAAVKRVGGKVSGGASWSNSRTNRGWVVQPVAKYRLCPSDDGTTIEVRLLSTSGMGIGNYENEVHKFHESDHYSNFNRMKLFQSVLFHNVINED